MTASSRKGGRCPLKEEKNEDNSTSIIFSLFFFFCSDSEEDEDAALPARGGQDLATWIALGQELLLH